MFFCFTANGLFAQKYKDWLCPAHARMDQKAMMVLGGWAITNGAFSGISLINAEGRNKYFHQMNLGWAGVNLALAVPFYLKARRDSKRSEPGFGCRNKRSQNLFLINTFLDAGYMGAGAFMMFPRTTNTDKANRLKGFGSAILLQGAFLFAFDLVMFLKHRRLNRKAASLK